MMYRITKGTYVWNEGDRYIDPGKRMTIGKVYETEDLELALIKYLQLSQNSNYDWVALDYDKAR